MLDDKYVLVVAAKNGGYRDERYAIAMEFDSIVLSDAFCLGNDTLEPIFFRVYLHKNESKDIRDLIFSKDNDKCWFAILGRWRKEKGSSADLYYNMTPLKMKHFLKLTSKIIARKEKKGLIPIDSLVTCKHIFIAC